MIIFVLFNHKLNITIYKTMKEIVLNIPDNKYLAFINLIKSKFTDIQIKERKSAPHKKKMYQKDSTFEMMFLSEKSLAEDWFSDEDNRWDEVL